jgi:hypothetical protein
MLNFTNMSYLNSKLLFNIRSTYLIDSLRLYFIVPMAIIGTLLNSTSFFILSTKSFKKFKIFKLMKIYNLISLLMTFGTVFFFLYTPHVLFELSISEIGRFYTCNFSNWILLLFYFYGNCLDMLMNLERALNYSNGYQNLKKISTYLICFIVLIICIIINLPSNLAQSYVPNDQLYIKFRLCYPTKFAILPVAKTILLASYIIEGPIVMILVIGSNILAYISYKLFMKRKQESTNNQRSGQLTESEKRKQAKTEKMDQKLLKMTIYLTIFSIISHLIQFGAQLITLLPVSSIIYGWTVFVFCAVSFIKHFFTIFFYYHFNLNFKHKLLALICKKKNLNILNTTSNNNNIQTS